MSSLNPWNSFPSFSGHLFICLSYSPKDTYGILIKILMYYKGFWYYTVCQTAFSYENCMHHKFYQICIKWHPLFNSCTCFWDQQLLHNFPKSDNKVSSLQKTWAVYLQTTQKLHQFEINCCFMQAPALFSLEKHKRQKTCITPRNASTKQMKFPPLTSNRIALDIHCISILYWRWKQLK